MPAEWEPHTATWLAWPHNRDTWPAQLAEVRRVWAQMVGAIAQGEQVNLLVDDRDAEAEVKAFLQAERAWSNRVVLHHIPTVDVWMRDYGPSFLSGQTGGLAFNDWMYNGWGGKYEGYEADDGVAKEIAKLLRVPVFEPGIVLEGGSIDVNGKGVCLTTEQCLLNPNRNPRLSKAQIEGVLEDYLTVDRVIWLGEGIEGDDTDGHIDDLARFVNSTTVACILGSNERDEDYRRLRENYERLAGFRDHAGKKLDVIPLPTPEPLVVDGARLPASYANFYIANAVVLVPAFDQPSDDKALGILADLFPGRQVLGIPCAAVVYGLGAIHCVTQQQPAP
ncbi:MAG: agmatine deiminase family protein [Candidatus Binatia bacterium]